MSEVIIRPLKDWSLAEVLPGMRDIFFENSVRKDFATEEEREKFFHKYLGVYLENCPELTYVAYDRKVLGYITGSTETHSDLFLGLQPHLELFKDHFEMFPAHLHISLHQDTQGIGLGSKILVEFEKKMKSLQVEGIHLISTPSSRNRKFYSKNGYSFEVIRPYQGIDLLLMGKRI